MELGNIHPSTRACRLPLSPFFFFHPLSPMLTRPSLQAYVKQEDVFYSQLTVRETLVMSARLRLPSSMSLDEKTAMVDELMNKLGLSKVSRHRTAG